MANIEVRKPIGSPIDEMLDPRIVKTTRYPLVFASGTTVKSFTINANALTHTIVLKMPGFSGANPTATLSIENSDDDEIYTNGGMVESSSHVMAAEKPLIGDNTVKVTLSVDPLSDGTAYVTIYLKGK